MIVQGRHAPKYKPRVRLEFDGWSGRALWVCRGWIDSGTDKLQTQGRTPGEAYALWRAARAVYDNVPVSIMWIEP